MCIRDRCRIEKNKLGVLKNPFLKLGLSAALAQNSPAPEEDETAGYGLFNIGIGSNIQLFKQLVSIGLSVNNLFDTKYVDHLSTLKEVNYYNPGRNVIFTLNIPFGIQQNTSKN